MNTIVTQALADIFQIAAHGSMQQRRKHTDEPYHVHPQRVRALLEKYVPWATPDMLDAALLHDVVEDVGPWMLPLISRTFNANVAVLVDGLTNKKACWEDGTPMFKRAAQKKADANRLKLTSREVKTIKLADVYDNVTDIIVSDPKFAPTFIAEKRYLLDYALKEGDEVLWAMCDSVIEGYYAENPQFRA